MTQSKTTDLTRLECGVKPPQILEALERDSAVISERFRTEERADAIVEALDSSIQQTAPVGDDFAGHQTTRAGGHVNKPAGSLGAAG